jgi:hypothetical protein
MCATSSIFERCAGNQVIMANEPAITEKNLVTSAAKSTRGQKSVPGSSAGTGTGKARTYRLLVRCAASLLISNPIIYVKGGTPKRDTFIVKQRCHPSDPSTPHRRRSTTPLFIHSISHLLHSHSHRYCNRDLLENLQPL